MQKINHSVGLKLKEIRLEKGLSREQVARRVGVSQQCIQKYEKGQVDISICRLAELAKVLSVELSYLITLT